jgi:putative two-component system response regulator
MNMEQVNPRENSVPSESWELLEKGLSKGRRVTPRGKILIVDASAEGREKTKATLGDLDHELVEASSTSEAIAAISIHRVDLVLIDLVAPELGAIEFCRMVKKATATQLLPVFVIAASDDLESEVRAIEAGADEFFVAPLRPQAFHARVQASLRHKAVIDSLDDSETVLFSLAQSVEDRDPSLGQHCERLSLMAGAMGVALGLPPQEILVLQRGGFLHDIGKVGIPDGILFKAGPLTPEEWAIMKSHAERGERICSNMRSLAPVLPIIRSHHERWDGTGYPDGLKGEAIPLLARILQLADIYDALTTERPYKRALKPEEALRVIREEVDKGWRDPRLVELFADLLPMFETTASPDFSRLSLHALASSIERFRSDAGKSESSAALIGRREPASRIGGL